MSNVYRDDQDDYYDMHGDDQDLEDDDPSEYCDFADPGGTSALRAESATNPRNLPCPTCGREDMLTPKDVALSYQCDVCADRAERGGDY